MEALKLIGAIPGTFASSKGHHTSNVGLKIAVSFSKMPYLHRAILNPEVAIRAIEVILEIVGDQAEALSKVCALVRTNPKSANVASIEKLRTAPSLPFVNNPFGMFLFEDNLATILETNGLV